eukprot:m.11565 g.11565  ORF g.11565 m.11565 type:complete len:1113 (-) comp2855_c0_seq1:63-3401(-)
MSSKLKKGAQAPATKSAVCQVVAIRMRTALTLVCGAMIGALLRSQYALDGHHTRLRQQETNHASLQYRRGGHSFDMIAGVWSESDAGQTPYWFSVPGKVPPLIHQIWDDEIVEGTCQISAQSWEWFCSVYGCTHKLWRRSDLEALTPFVNRQYYLDTESPQMRADLARLEILNKYGGLYLDCDMIWGGRSRASDSFVKMMMHSDFALAASNDIRNATGQDKQTNLAVVFFTNRIMGSPVGSPIIERSIQIANTRLEDYNHKLQAAVKATMGKGFKAAGVKKPKIRAFHMTGPHTLNTAIQEVGDSIPVDVVPTKWVYPEAMTDIENVVMFGHSKDRSVHAGTSVGKTVNAAKPWLMQRSLPNFFTVAQDPEARYDPSDYLVQPGSPSNPQGAVAIFLHHNKAGGTGVKVALQQMYNATEGLTHVDVFSKSACAYSTSAVWRNKIRTNVTEKFCTNKLWKQRKLPGCGRCRAPGLETLYDDLKKEQEKMKKEEAKAKNATTVDAPEEADTSLDATVNGSAALLEDEAPNGWTGEKGLKKCRNLKNLGKCTIPILKGKCCNTCGELSCPNAIPTVPQVAEEVAPGGAIGAVAHQKCQMLKKDGMCSDPRIRGHCCVSCGAEACSVPHLIVGDYAMGLCNVLPASRPCAYYTMLREPRKRMASSYLHCKYEPDDQLCMSHVLQAKNATFAEWVRHQGNYLFRQLTFDLSRALSVEEQYEMYMQYERHREKVSRMGVDGAWMPEPTTSQALINDDDLVEKMLQFKPNMLWLLEQTRGYSLTDHDSAAMVDLLEYRFAVLGLVEYFDESLEMYETVFGLPFPDAMLHRSQAQADHQMHRHSGEDLSRRKQVQEELLAQFTSNPELDQLISVDLQLYDRALELFERQRGVMQQMRLAALAAEGQITDESLESSSSASATAATGWLQRISSLLHQNTPESKDDHKYAPEPVATAGEKMVTQPASQAARTTTMAPRDPTAVPKMHAIKPDAIESDAKPVADKAKPTPSSSEAAAVAPVSKQANAPTKIKKVTMGKPSSQESTGAQNADAAEGKKAADYGHRQIKAVGVKPKPAAVSKPVVGSAPKRPAPIALDPSTMSEEDLAAAAEHNALQSNRRLTLN